MYYLWVLSPDCWEHFSVFWCFTAQRIRSMMRIMMSGSLVRNSLSVSACKNVNSCLLHWGENTERPWKIKWFHFSTHRATLHRVHERLSDLMLPYQCYLTDAAADICYQWSAGGRRPVSDSRETMCDLVVIGLTWHFGPLTCQQKSCCRSVYTIGTHTLCLPVHTQTHTHKLSVQLFRSVNIVPLSSSEVCQ